MSREIHDHKTNPLNQQLHITAEGLPGAGGSPIHYAIGHFGQTLALLNFHAGDPANGVNGITNESLLAVVIDRLRGFQSGPCACRENAVALTHLETALLWLGKRSAERIARGVEGRVEP